MKKINFMDKYPISIIEIDKSKTKIKNTNEFINLLKQKIEDDIKAVYIGTFDHFNHTKKLGGEIVKGMIDGKIILFCFGERILDAKALSIRPRNIAIVEFDDKFVISFLEAPMDKANNKKEKWIKDCINK